jgi:uncharacterized membrane protein
MQRSIMRSYFTFVMGALVCLSGLATLLQAEEKEVGPERGIAVYTEYSGIFVPQGETVRMELTADNRGKKDENIVFSLAAIPKGWKAFIKGPSYTVSSVTVPGRKTRVLTFNAEPEKGTKPGNYIFQIDARTEDGQYTSTQKIDVTMREKTIAAEDFQVTTSYPVLKGQADAKFEFAMDVSNKSESDKNFTLSAQAPEKWEANFKPAYEQKQISSLRIKGGQNQSVSVEVTPPKESAAGTYPIIVLIGSGDKKVEVKLAVVLSGTYQLDAGTPTGLLSLDASVGKTSNLSIFVRNTGSAVNRNVSFNSFKPENWKVEFKPEKIEALEPGALKQVEVSITPSAQSLVGDYSVAVSVEGEKSSKSVELRVNVKTSSAWGWIGLILIILVIAGLGGLFLRLGRR